MTDKYFKARFINHVFGLLDLLQDYDEELYDMIVRLLTDIDLDDEGLDDEL